MGKIVVVHFFFVGYIWASKQENLPEFVNNKGADQPAPLLCAY